MKAYTSKLIFHDGTILNITPNRDNKFTLEELQKYVEGYIQIIYLQYNLAMIINEEGKFLDLPKNEEATKLANFHPDFDDYIVGNVVICKLEQF